MRAGTLSEKSGRSTGGKKGGCVITKAVKIHLYVDDERLGTMVLIAGEPQRFVCNQEYKGKPVSPFWETITGYEVQEEQ